MCPGRVVTVLIILRALGVPVATAFLQRDLYSGGINDLHQATCLMPFPFVGSKRSQKSSLVVQAKKAYDDSTYGPFDEGDVGISRDRIGKDGDGSQAFFSLYYRMYNSTGVKDCSIPKTTSKLPLVVLHGGPSLPSQYLYPLVSHLSLDRPIIFYDQLGCGKSDEPKEPQFYSIAHSVADLDTVLTTLGFSKDSRVHLFGHSYGGNLAFEFAKARPQLVQSLLLSNTPANMKQAGDSYDRLAARNPVGFWKERVCSVESPSLDNAMQNSGSVWAGMDVVLDYVASPPPMVDGKALFPSTLVVTCARDFAVESSQGWNSVLQGITNVELETVHLEKCAHYPHLEDGDSFGSVLEAFMTKHDG